MSVVDDGREWLETDGLGGFAMGTVAGVRTRRYHGCLIAATSPPTGRMSQWCTTLCTRNPLSTNQ